MIKGKNGFWLLVIVFSLMTMLVIFNGENFGTEIVKGMDGTMGRMMAKEHAAGSTLSDLFNNAWSHQAQPMQGHQPMPPVLKSLDLMSTSALLVMLPLILGTSVLMIILWI
ncbi:MAG: hypothetical protein RO469_16180 [Thermincola sp.]|jgi:hypothetical protein|nr:hypothetical protein [Thermincola sp.]MDT3704781.1 hypothetical protein [Thermincola sp.]